MTPGRAQTGLQNVDQPPRPSFLMFLGAAENGTPGDAESLEQESRPGLDEKESHRQG